MHWIMNAPPACMLLPCSPPRSALHLIESLCPLQTFGRGAARKMVVAASALLAVPIATWRRSLATLALCWVEDPAVLALRVPRLLCSDLAAPASVTARIVLQRGLALPAAAVYARLPRCIASTAVPPAALAARIDVLQELGSDACSASSGRESGASRGYESGSSSDSAAAVGRLSMGEVCHVSDAQFAARLGLPVQSWAVRQAAFEQSASWQHLQREADVEAERLRALLATAELPN